MPMPLFESIRRTPTANEGESESVWMSPAAYRPLVMEERKSLGTAERIRLTDEILLGALFTGLGENRTSSHVEQGNIQWWRNAKHVGPLSRCQLIVF